MSLVDDLHGEASRTVSSVTDANTQNPGASSAGNGGAIPQFEYSASKYDNKYNVSGLSYPSDITTSPEYGGSYVIFYINVAQDSKTLRDGTVQSFGAPEGSLRGDLVGRNVTTAQAAASAAALNAGFGTLLGTAAGNVGGGAIAGAAIGALGAGVIAYNADGTDLVDEKAPTFSRPVKQLQNAIALHMPHNLQTQYSANWSDVDTAAFQAFARGGQEITRALSGDGNLKRTGGLAGEILGSLALNTAGGDAMGVGAGLSSNPKKEQAFQSVNFRTFSFDYKFTPKTSNEAKNIQNIIRTFKYHMHPEFKSEDAFLYVYPSEFDITYYFNNEENLNIHRQTSCVLTDMSINYAPAGNFNTFTDGMPTQIDVSLTFKELMLLSKETIEKYT